MSIKAWPFLVSRNRDLDYRTVVAPDFIYQAGISNLLAKVADGDLTKSEYVFVRKVQDSKVGDFTIIFRVLEATEKDINLQGSNQVLKDSFGRKIYLLEGFVIQEIGSSNFFQKDIDRVHNLIVENYSQFWKWTTPSSAISSTAFSLANNESDIPLKLEELEPFQVRNKASIPQYNQFISVGLIAAIITILLITMGLFLKFSFGNKELQKNNRNNASFLNSSLKLEF